MIGDFMDLLGMSRCDAERFYDNNFETEEYYND